MTDKHFLMKKETYIHLTKNQYFLYNVSQKTCQNVPTQSIRYNELNVKLFIYLKKSND